MTYEEFVTELGEDKSRPKDQRKGQWAFNLLDAVRPDIAAEARTSCVDPFYDDSRIPTFLWFVGKLWPTFPSHCSND